ncbi:MAG: phage Gp37/Gp68 family protein [Chloroflexi bacterium]|nr:phage Gp37/Gp68 family protein [Chloroflexota bacterium]
MGSKIEWTSVTWNPITGCSKASPGCKNCYAERMALRLRAMGQAKYRNGFQLTLHPDTLELPLSWKKPSLVFVGSMTDIFHDDVPFDYIEKILNTMRRASWHTFQVLTKRSARLLELRTLISWPDNVWVGVTVEDQQHTFRIDHLRRVDARVRFLSVEPLLGPIDDVDLTGIDWLIVGGESGPGARPVAEEWVIGLRDKCEASNVPFFFKQWGGVNKGATGRKLQGKIYDQRPVTSNQSPNRQFRMYRPLHGVE